jgi:hypothetical protein
MALEARPAVKIVFFCLGELFVLIRPIFAQHFTCFLIFCTVPLMASYLLI